ncbi:lytic polysaccharide monooxygenase [Paenibacillus sp. FJAT-26967]|uniref:lytic polysaccharide monooxygenase n=1 Tax=Paenibacillus sp. FJAT-26967 TaxID=1729690 RepID=UPI000837F1E6|nr:lytic polysaccharide monooxygenase [Paenibacillus sp. FJAT-26967]
MTTNLRLPQHMMIRWVAAAAVLVAMIAGMFLISGKASAHGYVEGPASRAYLCKTGQNTDCGAVVYEPQSLEFPKGFPAAGPADGKIGSGGGTFPKLDEQSSNRWTKVNINSGTNTFTWKLTAAHATTSWKYYITKPGWNPNAPLTRDSFDLNPFCSVDYKGKQPPFSYSDTCNVPARSGYQVILAVWEIADTANAFYNVIDVNFGGGSGGPTDTQAPTAPAGAAASNVAANSATVSWSASSDNVGVTGYRVFNGSTQIGSTTGATSLNLTGLAPNTAYTITVKAVDAAGNVSGASNAVSFTTLNGSSPGGNYPAWSSTAVYVGGNKVTHNGVNYEARWWTQGQTPSATSDVWKVIS